MHKNATKCNKTLSKWCKNKHGASKIIDTFETYQGPLRVRLFPSLVLSASAREGERTSWARPRLHLHIWGHFVGDPCGSDCTPGHRSIRSLCFEPFAAYGFDFICTDFSYTWSYTSTYGFPLFTMKNPQLWL
jgi:hypothetical protein